ncbi:MAG: sigma 54-interacting transcriptional regulator [Filomicrobium sp.]
MSDLNTDRIWYRQAADLLWSQALNKSELALVIIDPHHDRIVQFSEEAVEQLTGIAPLEFAKMPASSLFPEQLPDLIVLTQACYALGQTWDDRMHVCTAGGGTLPVEVAASSFAVGDNQYLSLLLMDREALQYRRLMTSLLPATAVGASRDAQGAVIVQDRDTQDAQNELILHAAGEGIYGVDADGLTTFVNPAAGQMLGWQPQELIGQVAHFMIHHSHECGELYPISDCPIYAALHDGAVHHVADEVFWRKDGSSFPVEYTSTPIRLRGRCEGAVIVFRDISERRETENKLKSALTEVEALRQRLEQENAYLQSELWAQHNHKDIVGESRSIKTIIQQIELVAPTDATVLITGESGTGKELIARAIHESSARAGRPLIRVNCAAIPKELFESEFFGHSKGAFTGAVESRVGRFELADGGTIFLDEVGELPLDQQAKLLRVLQEQQFERLGDTVTRQVDVRVIAATNQNLRNAVDEKSFREDLFFRLNVFPIEAPPLRRRKEDIPGLAMHFAEKACTRLNKSCPMLTQAEADRLKAHDWPGNIRELENAVERAVIVSKGSKLQFDMPALSVSSLEHPVVETNSSGIATDAMRREREKSDIVDALRLANGRVSGPGGAAELLGVKPTTLYSRLKKLKLNARRFRAQ